MRRAAPKLTRYYTHAQKFERRTTVYAKLGALVETCITPASSGKTGMVGYIKTGININQIIARKLHKKMMNCVSVRNDNEVETIIIVINNRYYMYW